jgi:hypothetical protein
MFRFVPRFAAVFLLVAAATIAPAAAGDRPLHAEGWGILYFNDYSAQLVGPGKSEHLGPCALSIGLDFNELEQNGNLVPRYLQLGARNGDLLEATVDLEFDPETGIIAGTITFTGVTGRFADASGSGHFVIVPDTSWFDEGGFPINVTRFSWSLDGIINY